MPNIKPVISLKSDSPPAVSRMRQQSTAIDPVSVRLDGLIERLRTEAPAERKWTVEQFQRDLSKENPETAGRFHQALLDRIDSLEQQGIRSRKAPGEQGQLYGLLMDLYHASRWVRDGVTGPAQLPQGTARPAVPLP
ncbi:MAG: hypothetical protein ACAI44_04665 [Candidatus Sericytochromatia bacterium]